MFQKFLDGYFLLTLAPGHHRNGASWVRVFQLPVDERWGRLDGHFGNQ